MKTLKNLLAVVLIVAIISGSLPLFQQSVRAAVMPVNIYVDSYNNEVLTFHWDKVLGAKSFLITYHTPDGVEQNVPSNSTGNSATISGLMNDYIYDIKLSIYSDIDLGGNLIGEGLIYYLPRVSFYATRVEQEREAIVGGGYEIGNVPRLNLKWVMPKVWDGAQYSLAHEETVMNYVKNNLLSVYKSVVDVSTLNFRINISSSLSMLNSGSSQSSVLVNYTDDGYIAYVSGSEGTTSKVYGPDADGIMNVDLIGRKDLATALQPAEEYGLPDGDLLPGTVYYMNIKLSYQSSTGISRYVTTVGDPADLNGSNLMGSFPYTYTPIRFQLSKDSANNVYIKIYKVNQGSLDLPRLYYEVQTSDDETIKGDWSVKKTIDDSFFAAGSDNALTLISGVGPNNKIFYRIVVKTDTTDDRLDSMPMHYTLSEDTSKSPVPTGITVIGRTLVSRTVEVNGATVLQKSSDITISWEKPANWDEIRANTNVDDDVVYHVLLNTSEEENRTMPYPELKSGDTLYGYFPTIFRRVLYFSSKEVKENGNRLEYTIKGFNLFKGTYYNGLDESGKPVIMEESIKNDEKYPDFLLPNKVYYLQMYTTNNLKRASNEDEDMSDLSVILSFTTKAGDEIDVPLPKRLRLNVNDADVTIGDTTKVSNYVELQFDKVDINWNNYIPNTTVSKAVYYDLYMSSRSDLNSFKLIGTTEDLDGDVTFIGADDVQSTSIRLIIRDFSKGTDAYALFGPNLRPNTTYYFVVRTRLSAHGLETDKESAFTTILPVTTVKAVMGEPDESSKRPYAPVDFKIAVDVEGNQLLSSSRVTFSWTRDETDVVYNIIASSNRIEPGEGPYEGLNDAVYQSFIENFGNIMLDPSLENLPENFEYNPISKECRFTIDEWLFPNKLYYFSIRAIKKNNDSLYSSWVSIPVTTKLIEQPAYLEAVTDVQLGFFFNDDELGTVPEDYTVYLKAEKDLKFNLINKNKYTFVKFGTTCYVRLINLQEDTYYDVRVYKDNGMTLVCVKEEMKTRDSCHEIEIKWRGLPEYKYEISLMTYTDDSYIILDDNNLQEYTSAQGKLLPYYAELNHKTSGTVYEYYYARIKSIPVRMEDGTFEDQPLKSNTKYHIKVRAVKIDPVDTSIITYSKYLGPIYIRTDFNQVDYDNEDKNTQTEATYLDRINKLEQALFWRINIGDPNENKLMLKGDRMINALENSGSTPFLLDISYYSKKASSDILYIPVEVIAAMDTENRSLVVRTSGAEYSIRPNTFELSTRTEIKKLESNDNVKGIYYMLNIGRNKNKQGSIPAELVPASDINSLEVKAVGTAITHKQLKSQIDDRIYNKSSGLVQEKLEELLRKTSRSGLINIDDMINNAIDEIELELSKFIYFKMEGSTGIVPIVVDISSVKDFDNPILVKLNYLKGSGLRQPYVRYDGAQWQKLYSSVATDSNNMMFNVVRTGEYAILLKENKVEDLQEGKEQTPDIKLLLSKYDLSEVFGDLSYFYPEDKVKVREVILLYELVAVGDRSTMGLSINQKAQKFGLESLIGLGGVTRDVTRQETAKVLMLVYASKTGVNVNSLIPNRNSMAKDLAQTDSNYYKDVLMCTDLGLLELSGQGQFNPKGTITRGELASAFVRVLKLTGDI